MTSSDFDFERVVFYGRDLDEYVNMFALDLRALSTLRILDCCAGPSSFAVQAAQRGINVTACDPLYGRHPEELEGLVRRDAEDVARRQARARHLLHAQLAPAAVRAAAMQRFLADYREQWRAKRYVAGGLPQLPFSDEAFDMVLSANLLFIYSDKRSGGMMDHSRFDYEFHLKAILELVRVARSQLRIYPLQGPAVSEHVFLQPLRQDLEARGYNTDVVPVAQRDIIGAEHMLVVQKAIS